MTSMKLAGKFYKHKDMLLMIDQQFPIYYEAKKYYLVNVVHSGGVSSGKVSKTQVLV